MQVFEYFEDIYSKVSQDFTFFLFHEQQIYSLPRCELVELLFFNSQSIKIMVQVIKWFKAKVWVRQNTGWTGPIAADLLDVC